jgi:hypothetical protein
MRLLVVLVAAVLTACSGGDVEPELITAERQLTGLLDAALEAAAPGVETTLERREGECQDEDLAGIGLWLRDQHRTWTMPAGEVDAAVRSVARHWEEQGHEVRLVGEPGDRAAFVTTEDGLRASIVHALDPDADELDVHLAGSTGCYEPVLEPRFDPGEPPPTPLAG